MLRRRWGRLTAFQELLFLLFLRTIRVGFRIEVFHFVQLFRSDLRKMADEEDKFPTLGVVRAQILVLRGSLRAEGRHAAQAHPIFDGVIKFAIALVLCFGSAHIRGLGIKAASEKSISAAIIAMATGAVVGEMRFSFVKILGRGGVGILHRVGRRDGQSPGDSCRKGFGRGRFTWTQDACGG